MQHLTSSHCEKILEQEGLTPCVGDMTNESSCSKDLHVAHDLTWRYAIALLLVATLSTAAWLSLHLVISEQKSTAAVVNVSGRQRMLSQRTALFSNLLVHATDTERGVIRQKLNDAIQLMQRSHHGLVNGDVEMGLPAEMSPTVRSMYFEGDNGLNAQVETYIKAVYELLSLDNSALNAATPQLHYITQTAPNQLVVNLDRMVKQYQLEGEASVSRLQTAETVFWAITLLLLALEALLIFHPFVKHVKLVIHKLQQATEELQDHEEQLEEIVKQRTADLQNKSTELQESEEKFRLISTNAHDGIIIISNTEQVIYWNPAAEKIFGYTAEEVLGKNLHDLIIPMRYQDLAHIGFSSFRHSGAGNVIGKTLEIQAMHKNGQEFFVELSISAFTFKNTWHALGIVRDITERKRLEEEIHQLAFYDPLTNLPNRRLINDRLQQVLLNSNRTRHYAAFMMLDLDNFKPLNDAQGHAVGDMLLIEVANRLKASVREADSVGRLGGDEFVVLLNELGIDEPISIAQANAIAEKVRIQLSAPYRLSVMQDDIETIVEHNCSVSIGTVVFINHGFKPENICKAADVAMYEAKALGRNRIQFYDAKKIINF